MKITFSNTKYMQIYLSKDEFERPEINDIIQKYKNQKYKIAFFITGTDNYSEIIKNIIKKQAENDSNI